MEQLINSVDFQKKGYATIPLLSAKEVDYLSRCHEVLPENNNDGFYTSLNHQEKRERQWVDHCVEKIIYPRISGLLLGYEPLFGTFTIKKKGGASDLAIHLDWSVVDEEKYNAIGVWVPLCDVSPQVGSFGLLEGSFKFGQTIRGSMINFIYAPGKGKGIMKSYVDNYRPIQFEMNAGTAIVYDMRTAHFSTPNMGDGTRVAANLIMVSKGSQPTHYFRSAENRIKEFQVDKNYFLENPLGAHNTDMTENRVLALEDLTDIEEQYGTTQKVDSIDILDFRKSVSNASVIDKVLNKIKVAQRFKKFEESK